jgi:hypothetical protein
VAHGRDADEAGTEDDVSERVLSSHQREILEALVRHWELLRCRDGARRWHMGELEVDGRAVRGLLRRGLLAYDPGGYAGGQLVLTNRGREVLL